MFVGLVRVDSNSSAVFSVTRIPGESVFGGHTYHYNEILLQYIPFSGYFSGGKIFVDMENFAASWK